MSALLEKYDVSVEFLIEEVRDHVDGSIDVETIIIERVDNYLNINGPWLGLNFFTEEEGSAIFNETVEEVRRGYNA